MRRSSALTPQQMFQLQQKFGGARMFIAPGMPGVQPGVQPGPVAPVADSQPQRMPFTPPYPTPSAGMMMPGMPGVQPMMPGVQPMMPGVPPMMPPNMMWQQMMYRQMQQRPPPPPPNQ